MKIYLVCDDSISGFCFELGIGVWFEVQREKKEDFWVWFKVQRERKMFEVEGGARNLIWRVKNTSWEKETDCEERKKKSIKEVRGERKVE